MRISGVLAGVVVAMAMVPGAWAADYLSNYYGGGYYPYGSTDTGNGYTGSGGYISRPHRSSWEGYLWQQQRLAKRFARQGYYYPVNYQGSGAQVAGIYNPMGISIGWPQARVGIPPCGTYMRQPAYCYGRAPSWTGWAE